MIQEKKEAPRWESLTNEQREKFSMYGNVEILNWYFSDLNATVNENLYNEETVNKYLKKIKNKEIHKKLYTFQRKLIAMKL